MQKKYTDALKGPLLFVVYLLSARMGLKLAAVSGFAALIWLPTGIAFAALFLWGRRFWPAIFFAAMVVNFWTGAPILTALSMGIGNTLEAVLGVTIFLHFAGTDTKLDKIRHVTVFVLGAALISTMVSATIGVLSLSFSGMLESGTFVSTWRAWWIGDVLSDLVVAPFLIIWSRKPRIEKNIARLLEGFILGFLVILLCVFIFGPFSNGGFAYYVKSHWIFLLLIWATLRFGQHANVLLTLVLSFIAIWGTVHGSGPYRHSSLNDSLILLPLFTGAVALTGLFFGALGREKNEALRIRTDFISIVSHELRTPLTSLNLSLEVLKHHIQTDDPVTKRTLESLERQSQKLSTLVNSLLNVAQIESGNLSLEKKETDLSTLVKNVGEELGQLAQQIHCELKFEIQPMVNGICSGYGIEQVITNLVMNSIKYGEGKPVTISLVRSGNTARICVRDKGRGIAPENQKRIFERYERLDVNKNSQGLGLGLYVSKLIVDAHHGKILVDSAEGEGATFTVDFPV